VRGDDAQEEVRSRGVRGDVGRRRRRCRRPPVRRRCASTAKTSCRLSHRLPSTAHCRGPGGRGGSQQIRGLVVDASQREGNEIRGPADKTAQVCGLEGCKGRGGKCVERRMNEWWRIGGPHALPG